MSAFNTSTWDLPIGVGVSKGSEEDIPAAEVESIKVVSNSSLKVASIEVVSNPSLEVASIKVVSNSSLDVASIKVVLNPSLEVASTAMPPLLLNHFLYFMH